MVTADFQLLYPIAGCFALLLFRYLLVRFLFAPIGLWCGISNSKVKKVPSNILLEREFSRSKNWNRHKILALSKQLDTSEERIEEWLSLKLAEVDMTVLKKFCDSSWNFFYYTSETIFGFMVLWDKSWLWDMKDCWRNLSVTNDVWLYFTLCSSFAWSQLVGLTFSVKRKDFYLMMVHHVGLILLLTFAGVCNFVRCISVAVFVCDSNDILLEVSKVAKYLGYEKIAISTFSIFTLWWIIVRVVLHPFWLTTSFLLDAPTIIPDLSPLLYYVVSTICVIFVIVNLLWTFFVLKVAIHLFLTGRGEDSRSETDE